MAPARATRPTSRRSRWPRSSTGGVNATAPVRRTPPRARPCTTPSPTTSSPENVEAVNPSTGRQISVSGSSSQATADLVARRPSLMEWAIGKGYDRYMDGTGKVIRPGERISWDQHIHAAGEAITGGSTIGRWLYPKGQEPKKRSALVPFSGLKNGTAGLDIPPHSVAHTEGVNVLRENTIITNVQPHFQLRGKAMQVSFPDGRTQVISYVKDFNWMTSYIFKDEAAPTSPTASSPRPASSSSKPQIWGCPANGCPPSVILSPDRPLPSGHEQAQPLPRHHRPCDGGTPFSTDVSSWRCRFRPAVMRHERARRTRGRASLRRPACRRRRPARPAALTGAPSSGSRRSPPGGRGSRGAAP